MAAKTSKAPVASPSVASDKKKALETALAQIEKNYGKGAIMRLGEDIPVNVDAISTGSLSLDLALGVGVVARLMSQALRKLAGTISKTNCIVVFINQLREKIGVMYGNPETTPGGRALKYFSSVRIDVRRIETLKVGGEMVGNRTRAKIVKNKVAPPFKEAEFDIIYGEGISRVGEIIDLGAKLELIEKSGAWFTVAGERLQGRDAVKEYLNTHPDVCESLEQQIRDNAYKLMTPQALKAAQAAGRAVDVSADDFEG